MPDWRVVARETLVVLLERAQDLGREATNLKDLVPAIEQVAEIVGTAEGIKGASPEDGGDDDE